METSTWEVDLRYKELTVIMENGNRFSIRVAEDGNSLNVHKKGKTLTDRISIIPVVSNVVEIF